MSFKGFEVFLTEPYVFYSFDNLRYPRRIMRVHCNNCRSNVEEYYGVDKVLNFEACKQCLFEFLNSKGVLDDYNIQAHASIYADPNQNNVSDPTNIRIFREFQNTMNDCIER